jgi:hypothetical protein
VSNYNPFHFIRDRRKAIEPTPIDFEQFDNFMTSLVLSMRRDDAQLDVTEMITQVNSLEFSKLSKKQQCMCYTSLDGLNLYGKWAKPKKKKAGGNKHTDMVDKIMKVFDCSMNTAESYLKTDLIDEKELENTYAILYDPSSLIKEAEKADKKKATRKRKPNAKK